MTMITINGKQIPLDIFLTDAQPVVTHALVALLAGYDDPTKVTIVYREPEFDPNFKGMLKVGHNVALLDCMEFKVSLLPSLHRIPIGTLVELESKARAYVIRHDEVVEGIPTYRLNYMGCTFSDVYTLPDIFKEDALTIVDPQPTWRDS